MTVECWAIIIIVLAIAFIFLRTGRKNYFFGIIPLTFVPFLYLIGLLISSSIANLLHIMEEPVRFGAVTVGLFSAGICFGIFSRAFKNKKTKAVYLLICGGFTVILSIILTANL